jgi:acyl carrier protein
MDPLAAARVIDRVLLRRHSRAISQMGNVEQIRERIQMSDQVYVLAKVQEAFKAAFDIDPQSITMETTASDISAWDSVGHLSLAGSLEEIFEVSLDVDDLMEMENVREIVRIISSKLAKKV